MSPRMIDPFHPVSVGLGMLVNLVGIVLIVTTYVLHHNLLGLNLTEALFAWFVAQFIVIYAIIR